MDGMTDTDAPGLLPLEEGGPWAALRVAASAADYAQAWLDLQARQLPQVRAGVVILGNATKGGYAPLAIYPPRTIIGPDLARTAEAALGEGRGVLRERPGLGEAGSACIAWPVMLDDALQGIAAFELAPGAEPLAVSARRLQWGTAWLELLVRRKVLVPPRRLAEAMDLGAALAEAPSLNLGLQGLVGELAALLSADWAAIGRMGQVETVASLAALSHRAAPQDRAALAEAIRAAMQEALDQRAAVALPAAGDTLLITRAHEGLAEVAGAQNGGLVSVPMPGGGDDAQAAGVLTLARAQPFAAEEVEFLRLLATWHGPLIALRQREEMGLLKRLSRSLRQTAATLLGRRRLGLKLLALAVLIGTAIGSSVEIQDRVSAAARLEGRILRAVTTPMAGYVAKASARAGDVVVKDQVLAELDARDLQVERARWIAERARWSQEYQRAFAAEDRGQVGVQKARIDEAQARMDVVDDLLTRTTIRAPMAGLVVNGDLDHMIGAPVQRGDVLFEVAPLDDYRVAIDVDERDVGQIAVGQTGQLLLTGLAELALPIEVTLITPISRPADGRNTFRVEARLAQASDLLRPGMQGHAKIDTARRPILTVLTEPARNWLALTWWRWSP